METIRLTPPVKYVWRDGYKVFVDSIATLQRYLSQPFGVNWAVIPYSQITGDIGHPGLDFAVPVGQPIFAAHDAVVVERDDADDTDGLGLSLYNQKQNIQTWYWHNSTNLVALGETVKQGQRIALSGGTGKSYGPHLHFALYQTDAKGIIINKGNGYGGAIDPIPYLHMPVFNPTEMSEDFIKDMYNFYFGRLPNATELADWLGKNYRDLLKAMLRDKLTLFE